MTTDTAVLVCSMIISQRTHHAALLPPLASASSSSTASSAAVNAASPNYALHWEPEATLRYVTAPPIAPFVLQSIPWVDDPEIETGMCVTRHQTYGVQPIVRTHHLTVLWWWW